MELLSFYIRIYLPFAPIKVQFTQKCSKATGTPMVKGLIDMFKPRFDSIKTIDLLMPH